MSDDGFAHNYLEGVNRFQSARMRAFWSEIINHLRGQPAELLSFDDVKARLRLHEESYRGLQDVPLDNIVGSVGRYREFTADFLPRSSQTKERWSRIYAEANSLRGLPPIELYKVGDVYFVRDGNHRVSVARQLGSKSIEAHVTELNSPVEVHPHMTLKEWDAAAAAADFLAVTGLRRTRPHHQPIVLSEVSRYGDLLGHIHLHKAFMERISGGEVGFQEAAADWYDNVYRPAITLIRKYNVIDLDHKRTETDLYLWLVDHLAEVKEEYGEHARTRTFSDALTDFLQERNIPIPGDLLTEPDESVQLTRKEVREMLRRQEDEKARGNGNSSGA